MALDESTGRRGYRRWAAALIGAAAVIVVVVVVLLARDGQDADEGGGAATTAVSFDGSDCVSGGPVTSSEQEPSVLVANESDSTMALIFGTYDDGYSRDDLVEYAANWPGGSDRPAFVEALEILEVSPSADRTLTIEHGPGTYFAACMAQPDILITLEDIVVAE